MVTPEARGVFWPEPIAETIPAAAKGTFEGARDDAIGTCPRPEVCGGATRTAESGRDACKGFLTTAAEEQDADVAPVVVARGVSAVPAVLAEEGLAIEALIGMLAAVLAEAAPGLHVLLSMDVEDEREFREARLSTLHCPICRGVHGR